MKKKSKGKRAREVEKPWARALDVAEFDRVLPKVVKALRCKRHLNLSQAARRSGMSRQGWRKVERRKASPTTHSDVVIGNALRVRPSEILRMVEDWLDGKQQAAVAVLLPFFEEMTDFLFATGV